METIKFANSRGMGGGRQPARLPPCERPCIQYAKINPEKHSLPCFSTLVLVNTETWNN